MEKSLEERIRHAVDEGRKARSEYYDVIDLPNEQQLGAPAPNELIIELETRLGKKLPPSYRVFLSLYDGWRMVDGAMDLLSIGEMLEGAREKKISEWQKKALVEQGLFCRPEGAVQDELGQRFAAHLGGPPQESFLLRRRPQPESGR